MGECLRNEVFRVVDISVQRSGGSHANFMRNPTDHKAALQAFFDRTGNDYMRFNYLGEWHSHPSFEPVPSITDIHTMQSIVEDPAVGANFAILLVAKLNGNTVNATATVFRPDQVPTPVSLSTEAGSEYTTKDGFWNTLRKMLWP